LDLKQLTFFVLKFIYNSLFVHQKHRNDHCIT